tara:strand:- start:134 stop:1198 length:1065 start_codon:yes stop_codon:yes gene_type:complete
METSVRLPERRLVGLKSQVAEIIGRRLSACAVERLADFHGRYLRGMKGGRRVVLRACNLSGLDLSGYNFSDAELPACDFSEANLTSAKFVRANLFGAHFNGADLSNTSFERADLRGAKFDGAKLYYTHFKGADLRRGEVLGNEGKILFDPSCSFKDAALTKSDMATCKMMGVDFNGASLSDVKLTGADLRDASFDGAKLAKVDMQGANLLDADMTRTAIDEDTEGSANLMRSRRALRPPTGERLAEILLEHSRWVRSNKEEGERANFSETDLTRFDLSGHFLPGANFTRAVLVHTNLTNAFLAGADMRHAILIDTLLDGADLRGTDLRGALTEGTVLETTKQGALDDQRIKTRL